MTRIVLPYHREKLPIDVPNQWLGQVILPRAISPARDIQGLISNALNNPIGSPPIADMVKAGQKIAILVDDHTRNTPHNKILPILLEQIHAQGIPKKDVCIIMALGSHRPMTGDEIIRKLGAQIAGTYSIVNVSHTAESELVYLGEATNGIPAYVLRAAVEADVRIGVGMIAPHPDAGFGGGMKIVLPGVCGARTVDAFHARTAFSAANQLGKAEAQLRVVLEQFVTQYLPLDFIVNVILTTDDQVYQCIAGHPLLAHREGVRYAQAVYGAPSAQRFPVVLANCYPYDHDLWQSDKGMRAGDLLTADSGTLIVITAAPEGKSNYPCLPKYIGQDPDELRQKIIDGAVKDRKQAAYGVILRDLMRRINLVLVSSGLTEQDARTMGIPYYDHVEAALLATIDNLPAGERRGSVAVITHAGVVLPLSEARERPVEP